MSKTNGKLLPEQRRREIVRRLEHQPKVLVHELAEEFHVSQFTIRTDFNELESRGQLQRCHGGALPPEKNIFVLDYGKRFAHMAPAKQAIGSMAATLVSEGDCIAVDTGTTTIELIRHLDPQISLTLITNDFSIANLVEESLPNATLYFLGGVVRRGYRYTASIGGLDGLEGFNTDIAFLSASAFSTENGFMSEDPEQAYIKRTYLTSARKRYALLDSSKFKRVSFIRYATIDEIDGIITENSAQTDAQVSAWPTEQRCQLIVAPEYAHS